MNDLFNIPPGSKGSVYGDSETDPQYPAQMIAPLIAACAVAAFLGNHGCVGTPFLSHAPEHRAPTTFLNHAISGSTIQAVNTRIDATLAYDMPDWVIISEGTNERSKSRPQTIGDIAAQAAKFPATMPILLIGPAGWGWEAEPNTVAGANDQRLDETATDLEAFATVHPNVTYVNLRATIFKDRPLPGSVNGPWTADGAHWTRDGAVEVWEHYVSPSVSFNP